MAILRESERAEARAISGLSYSNPFLPERIEFERTILGDGFIGTDEAWHKHADEEADRPNIDLLTHRAQQLADTVVERLRESEPWEDEDLALYEDVVVYLLFNKYSRPFFKFILQALSGQGPASPAVELYDRFQEDMLHYFAIPGITFSLDDADHLFACFFQIRRAFHHIYDNIIGGSMVSARLRAAVWQSIFTCDMRRYRRELYRRMDDVTTLISGPSGTGKELVAQAVGLSRYIPFDPRGKSFAADFTQGLHPLNLSTLSPTLIESELFGHTKGAFTGALKDKAGFFEACPPHGAIFLDEIGDLSQVIQVKLLRVLQTRTFQRIGDTDHRQFNGKVVAATNRDLTKEMQEGRFREDLYYRLCSDIIVTPSLREQLAGSPEQLRNLLLFIAIRVAGEREAEALATEVEQWIDGHLGPDYPWPGNVRELEQCVRNVMVRRTYQPPQARTRTAREAFLESVAAGSLSADELLRSYCTLVYSETGSYQETANRLGIDRRTVKSRIDEDLLAQYRSA